MLIDFEIPYDNFIFDVGNVLLTWSPEKILETVLPNNPKNPEYLLQIFRHPDWLSIDKGILDEKESVTSFSERTKLSQNVIEGIFYAAKSLLAPIEDTVNLLNSLSSMGKNLYCLTNMSYLAYERVRHFEFWSIFKGIVVSSHVKLVKPEPEVFTYTMNKFNLPIDNTIFIDDMKRNTDVAESLGIKSVIFTDTTDCLSQLREMKKMP